MGGILKLTNINVNEFKEFVKTLSIEDINRINQREIDTTKKEYKKFVESFKEEECYLCGSPLKTISIKKPCLHWLIKKYYSNKGGF